MFVRDKNLKVGKLQNFSVITLKRSVRYSISCRFSEFLRCLQRHATVRSSNSEEVDASLKGYWQRRVQSILPTLCTFSSVMRVCFVTWSFLNLTIFSLRLRSKNNKGKRSLLRLFLGGHKSKSQQATIHFFYAWTYLMLQYRMDFLNSVAVYYSIVRIGLAIWRTKTALKKWIE